MGVHQHPAWEMWAWDEDEPDPETQTVADYFAELYGDEPSDPCPDHPTAERWLCWCTPGVHGVRREFMRQDERTEIYHRTGVKVETTTDMRRAMDAKGLREAEKGEEAYDRFDALADAAEGHKVDERFGTGSYDLWGDYARMASRPKLNLQERYEYHRQRRLNGG